MKLYYFAHPVRPEAGETEDENLEKALAIYKSLIDYGLYVVMPWCVDCCLYPGDTAPRPIDWFLQKDAELVRRCDGIITAGPRVSRGMGRELQAAQWAGKEVIDLVGKKSEEIIPYLALGLRLEVAK